MTKRWSRKRRSEWKKEVEALEPSLAPSLSLCFTSAVSEAELEDIDRNDYAKASVLGSRPIDMDNMLMRK